MERTNIAVLDLGADHLKPSEIKALTNKLIVELINTEKFAVIEREQMHNILKEQGFQQTGCTSDACVVEVGQLLGVDKIVAGSIGEVAGIYLVSLRIVDVKTGKIIRTISEEIEGGLRDVVKRGIKNAAFRIANISIPGVHTKATRRRKVFKNLNVGCGAFSNLQIGTEVVIRMKSKAIVKGTITKNNKCFFLIDKGNEVISDIYKTYIADMVVYY